MSAFTRTIADKIYVIRGMYSLRGSSKHDYKLAEAFILELGDDRYTYDGLLDWFMENK